VPSSDRHAYRKADRSFGVFAYFVIGLGMSVGGLALGVGLILDLLAFPDAPEPIALSEAVALADPPRGSWVEISNIELDCAFPPGRSNSRAAWALVGDGSAARVLVHFGERDPPKCGDPVPSLVGVLSTRAPDDLPRLPWKEEVFSTPYVTVLWTGRTVPEWWLLLVVPVLVLPGLGMLGAAAAGARERWSTRSRGFKPLSHVGLAMPLSTGASAIQIFGTPMLALHLIAFGPLFFATRLPGWTVYPVAILWALWFFATVGFLLKGWTQRASDLRLGREGLEISGGPLHGRRHNWEDLAEGGAKWQRFAGQDPHSTLWIADEVVAISDSDTEHQSLKSVALTVLHLARQAVGAAPEVRTERPPHVLVCPTCGCPVPPTETPTAQCGRCDSEVVMPETLRDQVRSSVAFADVRRQSERLLQSLVQQPGATATNLLMLLAIPPLLIGFPLASILFDEFFQLREVFRWQDGVALFVGAMAFSYGLLGILRGQISGRQALWLIACDFAARPPKEEGEPWFCRQCGAPLPKVDAHAVVTCVHCSAQSIIEIFPPAAWDPSDVQDLRAELAARVGQRRRYRLMTAGSLVLLAASLAVLWPVFVKMSG